VLERSAVQPRSATTDQVVRTPAGDGVALAFERVSKVFPDGTRALDEVTIQVKSGEMVAIVGPSGCGKSTLLRLASRLSAPSSGQIVVGDGNLGYVFQDATLLPWRTVQRHVELLAELAGMNGAQRA
jgi:NitT/TauT family transport system ATP-binding protein